MEILAGFLRERSEIQNIALVTSLFHVRRTVDRLNEYADGEINIFAIDIRPRCKDRMPWIVLLEPGKMARDRMNLSRAQLFSRTSAYLMPFRFMLNGGNTAPFSVTMAVTSSCGVTSKAGL